MEVTVRAHLHRWGAVWILVVLFIASWAGQFFAQLVEFTNEQAEHGQLFEWAEFWPAFLSSTLENWQSEYLQLACQALLISAFSHVVFRKGNEDADRLEAKVDELLARLPDSRL
jgi:low affinity Fe/Cu permease